MSANIEPAQQSQPSQEFHKDAAIARKSDGWQDEHFQRMRDDLAQAKALLAQFTRELDAWLLQT